MPILKLAHQKPVVISIGGSLLVPNGGPDASYLTSLHRLVRSLVKDGRKLVLVTGGGKTARHYIQAAREVHKEIDPEDLDWIGIHATRLNAHLVRTLLRDIAHPVVVKDPHRIPKRWKGPVLVGAGWKPGWSTDYVASAMAHALGVAHVINASDIDAVYDKDPHTFDDAKRLEEMQWKDFSKAFGTTWNPGLSAPFDPVAAKLCAKNHISAAILHGRDIPNVKKAITGKKFSGTILY